MSIGVDDKCTGCGACAAVCRLAAIDMVDDNDGFTYPIVNREKCVECGACNRACPLGSLRGNAPINACAYTSRRKKTAQRSASGGFILDLMREWVAAGGVVVGASDIPHVPEPGFCVVDCVEDCEKLAGSKYVQVDLSSEIHGSIKKALSNGERVLFCGTPCQVAALAGYRKLGKLFLVDIVCQGVPSKKVLGCYRLWQENNHKSKLVSHSFRSKAQYADGDYVTELVFDDGSRFLAVGENDLYTRQFQRQIMLRESCYRCPFAGKLRMGDVTVGDYRGSLLADGLFEKGNVSVVLGNTEEGASVVSRLVGKEMAVALSIDDAESNNIPLHHPVPRPWMRSFSYSLLDHVGFPVAVRILSLRAYAKRLLKRG